MLSLWCELLTGKYREGDEKTIEPSPSVVCEDFSEAVDLILSRT